MGLQEGERGYIQDIYSLAWLALRRGVHADWTRVAQKHNVRGVALQNFITQTEFTDRMVDKEAVFGGSENNLGN